MALKDDYKNKCLTCGYYNLSCLRSKGFWCDNWRNDCPYRPEASCSSYYDAKRSESDLTNALRTYNRGYYLITVASKIMGLEENNIYTKLFDLVEKHFGDNEEFHNMIVKYDQIGPVLATCILNDENKEQTAYTMINNYINPAYFEIVQGNIENGVKIYVQMVIELEKKYGISLENLNKMPEAELDVNKVRTRVIKPVK